MISAVVFVFWPEEEDLIEACLKSVAFADEIVVIDNGATPKTIQIVKKFTSKIFKNPSKDFAVRHNFGKQKASGDWILYLDSDERISASLGEEITTAVSGSRYSAYSFLRVNFFLGKEVKFGDRYPDRITRLFKKDQLGDWTGSVHESAKIAGEIGELTKPLYHLTHRDIFTMVDKTINFSQHEAQIRFDANHPPVVWWRLIRVFVSEFFNRIIKMQGWRQGTEGWIDGIFQAFSLFVVYARLWELQRKPSLKETYRELDRKISEGEI
jgi:glycosyltransferase involved in cell wall biosynthesis